LARIEMGGVVTKPLHSIHKDQRGKGLTVGSDQILRSQRKLADGCQRFQEFTQAHEMLGSRGQ
jgi:hypothetical protein